MVRKWLFFGLDGTGAGNRLRDTLGGHQNLTVSNFSVDGFFQSGRWEGGPRKAWKSIWVNERARTRTDWGLPPGANFPVAGGDAEGKASSFHTSAPTERPLGKGGGGGRHAPTTGGSHTSAETHATDHEHTQAHTHTVSHTLKHTYTHTGCWRTFRDMWWMTQSWLWKGRGHVSFMLLYLESHTACVTVHCPHQGAIDCDFSSSTDCYIVIFCSRQKEKKKKDVQVSKGEEFSCIQKIYANFSNNLHCLSNNTTAKHENSHRYGGEIRHLCCCSKHERRPKKRCFNNRASMPPHYHITATTHRNLGRQ